MNYDLAAALRELLPGLVETQISGLLRFRDLLSVSANEFNLTSIRDAEGIGRRHIAESAAFGLFLQHHCLLPAPNSTPAEDIRVLDIGTGAGLPGIPLKLIWPALRLTLLESIGKKCRFLEMACETLGLEDVSVVEGRAEDFAQDRSHRENFDLVVARAVAPLPVLLEYALPALRVGGWLAAPKGSAALSEIEASAAALDALGGRLHDAAPFTPPAGLTQTVAMVEKTTATPSRFPRRAGLPSKRPL